MLFILFFAITSGYSQNGEFDSDGKKHNTWIIYLDNMWSETDSSTALYYRYTNFEHGINTLPMGPSGKKGWQLIPEISKNTQPIKLNGEYKWIDEKGTIRSVHEFENGKYLSCKEYDKSGELEQHFDYKAQYRDEPNTYYVILYNKEKETKFVMRNGANGWALYGDPGLGSDDDFK